MTARLDDLAEQMLGPASRLIRAVRERDVAEAHDVLGALDVLELRALAVRLADIAPVAGVDRFQRVTEVRHLCRTGEAAKLRHRAQASRGELAALVGVTETAISDWETGKFLPRGDNAIRYGAALDSLRAGLGESG
ncbi:helix-turn-helix transcriptional regulator [Nonomuraea sp. NPDC003804]|uniref:helix-turn-helix transcriptional regulator n=1 Tax=Nonomuraea sp. NPDC003804 TaxID=3154547 RepID=UPI0033AC543D